MIELTNYEDLEIPEFLMTFLYGSLATSLLKIYKYIVTVEPKPSYKYVSQLIHNLTTIALNSFSFRCRTTFHFISTFV